MVRVVAGVVWLVLVCAGNPPLAWGQGGRIDLAETVELARLVDLCAERLGLSIEYDTRLSGSVTLRLRSELDDGELWALTNRLLAARGFTTVAMGDDGTVSVVSLSSAASLARLESPGDLGGADAAGAPGFRAVLAPVVGCRVEDAVAAVKPFVSGQGGSVTGLAGSGAVLIADLTPRVRLGLAALERLESHSAGTAPVEVSVEHVSASELVGLVTRLAETREAAGGRVLSGELLAGPDDRSVVIIAPRSALGAWRELVERFDRPQAQEVVSYSPDAFGVGEVSAAIETLIGGEGSGVRVVADSLTGTVRVTATAAQHREVAELLDGLAAAPEAARRPTRSFTLKNRDADEVLGVVQSLVSAGVVGEPDDGGLGEGGGVGLGAPGGGVREAGLRLTADAATNTIIAVGGAAELDRLGRLLADLDVRRAQVLLEVLIVSLSESDSVDLGVEMEKLVIGPGDTVAKLSSLFGLSSTGAGSGEITDRSGGGSAIVLSPGDFSVVLRALRTINRGRSLSMPKVLVASNEQASLNSVLESPYATINASDTVATTAYGGSSPAGTEVSVTPQIAEGDHLRLEYQVSLSAFVGEASDASLPPPRQQNSINSVATIPDGFTIAVGGIELLTEGEAETGIPVLSDIPVLGEAFKNRSRSSSRSRFFVFIRPTILRDRSFEDLKYLSEIDVAETGVDDGWPVQGPRLIR